MPGARPAVVAAVVLTSVLLFPLTITGASVALPDVGADLGASGSGVRWVVTAYNAAFAAFLVFTGSLADVVGRRLVYAGGLAVFAVAGLVSALATDVVVLDLVRFVAGVGAAAAVTGGQAILAAAFEGAGRARVFGLVGVVLGAGQAFGTAVGGVLVDVWGWRAVFVVPAAVALVALGLVPLLPASVGERGRRVDWLGAGLSIAALVMVIAALTEEALGWLAPAGVVAVVFVLVERRRAEPLFDLGLLRDRRFAALALAAGVFMVVLVPLVVYLPSYLIEVVGLGGGEAGVWLLALTGPVVVLPLVSAVLVRRGVGRVVVGALALTGVGALVLTAARPSVGWWLVAASLLVGIGVGLTMGLLDGQALGLVAPEQVGAASGLFNTARLAMETIALAGVGALLAGGPSLVGTAGLRLSGLVLGVVALVACVLVACAWHNGSHTGFGSPRAGDPTTTGRGETP
ncbi:MFS transporter [Actinokineospora pegani]|uniref:MFS transporter n=1 Tax=Actinokineospora pegani TaxID=2654637 RepID=UPI002E26DA9E